MTGWTDGRVYKRADEKTANTVLFFYVRRRTRAWLPHLSLPPLAASLLPLAPTGRARGACGGDRKVIKRRARGLLSRPLRPCTLSFHVLALWPTHQPHTRNTRLSHAHAHTLTPRAHTTSRSTPLLCGRRAGAEVISHFPRPSPSRVPARERDGAEDRVW